ncbi:hypothetical protein GOC19_10760 [Sinorhizobium meliloti]|nr:hypothetical protein [Sinorhizobium meliloti]
MPWEPEYDPDWDSPEAVAKWRVRGIRDVHERAKEFHRIKAELEMEVGAAGEALVQEPLVREDEIGHAAIYKAIDET